MVSIFLTLKAAIFDTHGITITVTTSMTITAITTITGSTKV